MTADGFRSVWREDPAEDTLEMGLRQRAALFSATGVALAGLFTAIVLQTAYHALILLWVSLGLRCCSRRSRLHTSAGPPSTESVPGSEP
jgi:hypothetical protein